MSNRTCFELAVKMITASALTGVGHADLWRRECRFRQAACLTIAQRFSALALCVVHRAARSCLRLMDKRTSRGHRVSVAIDESRPEEFHLRALPEPSKRLVRPATQCQPNTLCSLDRAIPTH